MEIKTLTESCFSEATFSKDLIRNVVLLGSTSKNNRRYLTEAMKAAVPLYEGVQAFVNHPTDAEIRQGMRDVMKLAGRFKNIRFESGKIYGDFHGLPDDPSSAKFLSIAKAMPEIAGLSHNAQGKTRREGNVEVVEQIERVYSVDLVANPATTNGIFEHHNFEKDESSMDEKKINEAVKKIALGSQSAFDEGTLPIQRLLRTQSNKISESEAKKFARAFRR